MTNLKLLYEYAPSANKIVAAKSTHDIINHSSIGLHCGLEPIGFSIATGMRYKEKHYVPDIVSYSARQRRFEAAATTAFTTVHILALLLVITWFFLELKQNYTIAKWILHPLQQYKKDLELQREIWWYSHFLQLCNTLTNIVIKGIRV